MSKDEIVEDVRRVRQEHAAALNYDLRLIYDSLRLLEAESGVPVVKFNPKLPGRTRAASKRT